MCRVLYVFVILISVEVYALNQVLRAINPLYGISTLSGELNNISVCSEHLNDLQHAVDNARVWAVKVIDASGTPESGFVYANNLWLGSHAQCKDISNTKEFEVNNEKVGPHRTKYDYPPYPLGFAMVYFKHNSTLQLHSQLPLEWTIQLGLCVPKSCTKEDLLYLAKIYFGREYLEMQKFYHLDVEVATVKPLADDFLWILKLPKTMIFSVLFLLVLLLTVIGTIYDVRRHNMEKNLVTGHNGSLNEKIATISTVELVSKSSTENISHPNIVWEIVRCFSFYSNTKSLVKTKLSGESVSCIHGLRFMGMLWVIGVHAIYYQADYLKNVAFAYRLSEDIFAQILSNSTYCVDTYLFLSGFLVTYLYYKSKNPHEKSEKPTNYLGEFLMMYINRFLRLTPLYLVILLFTDVVYTMYRDNSSLLSSERADILCDAYWWRNLLYINNLFPRSEMCMSWSWYLSLDTQFFTVTIFLLILSTVAFKLSAIIACLLLLVSIVSTGIKSYMIGYIPTMDEQLVQLDAIYDLPWNRIGPYLVGGVTGYILKIKLQNKLILSKKKRILLWVVFPLLNMWILFTLYTRQVSVEFSAVYMGLSRTLWGIGLAWIVIACCTGNAQALQKFLSFKGFIPLSRLTYCAYLLNPLVATMIYLGSESAFNASLAGFVVILCGITMVTFYMSFLFYVLVESPCIRLTKIIFRQVLRKRPSESKPES